MDLLYNIVEQPNDDHGLDQTTEDVDDDDVFYAELERRILLLINTADENDDLMAATSYNNSKMRKSYLDYYSLSQPDQSYFDWTDSDQGSSSYSVPSRILNLWRSNVNGTGVFIPHTLKSKRKNKPRRKKNEDTAVYKEVGNKSRLSKDVE